MSSTKITSLVAIALVCSLAAGSAAADDIDYCQVCTSFVDTVQQNPQVYFPVADALYKPPFCYDDDHDECNKTRKIVQTAEVIVKFFEPKEICQFVELCNSDQNSFSALVGKTLKSTGSRKSSSLMGKTFGRKSTGSLAQIGFHPLCSWCEQVVAGFQEDFELTAKLLQKICELAPANEQKQCQQSAQKILAELKANSPKQYCAKHGLCSAN